MFASVYQMSVAPNSSVVHPHNTQPLTQTPSLFIDNPHLEKVILKLATWGHSWGVGYTIVGHVGEPTNREIQSLCRQSPVRKQGANQSELRKEPTKQRYSVGLGFPGMLPLLGGSCAPTLFLGLMQRHF